MVCSITLRPAKPILAPCSATIISPSIPKLAVTPPNVGSVNRLIYNKPSSSSRDTAQEVFAICIKLKALSCILAPPDDVIAKTGSRCSIAFSIILVSFQGDRTVLAHRGANASIKKEDINFEAIKKAKFLYIAPLNGDSTKVLDDIVNFAKENHVKVCFNAGSSSLKKGFSYLKQILEDAHIVVMNKEEASLATQIQVRPDTREEKFSEALIHPDIKEMFKKLKVRDYQIIVITDGGRGAYAYDGKKYYYCPVFDGPVVSTLGAGDAFASTFCAALGRTKLDIGQALMYASVNSAGVVSAFGATQGLLTFDEIEKRLQAKPEYTYKIDE